LLKNNPAFSERLGFIESWLEDHELFFEDMRHALKDIFKKVSGDAALPSYGWVGNELTAYLLQFDAGKFPKKRQSKEHQKLAPKNHGSALSGEESQEK
jgi:hypothetical protein